MIQRDDSCHRNLRIFSPSMPGIGRVWRLGSCWGIWRVRGWSWTPLGGEEQFLNVSLLRHFETVVFVVGGLTDLQGWRHGFLLQGRDGYIRKISEEFMMAASSMRLRQEEKNRSNKRITSIWGVRLAWARCIAVRSILWKCKIVTGNAWIECMIIEKWSQLAHIIFLWHRRTLSQLPSERKGSKYL